MAQRQPGTPVAFDEAQLADPYPLYHELRDADPVFWDPALGVWMLTRHADVVAALRDPRLGSERLGSLPELERQGLAEAMPVFRLIADMMLFNNPPRHGRLRAPVAATLTPRMVADLEGFVEEIVDTLLSRIEARAAAGSNQPVRFDAIRDLAYPLPTAMASALLGVSLQDSARFRSWWYDVMAFLKDAYTLPDAHRAAAEDVLAMTRFLHDLLARVRREGGSDLLERLARAETDEGRLDEHELIANAMLLLSVGQESTTNLIGNGLLALLRHPDQWERLRRTPELAAAAVEECLRYDSPVQFTGRRAVADLELGGRRIREGDYVLLFLGAANRDPAVFPEPDRFDIARDGGRHLAFGLGPHFCLGAPLARLEAAITFRALVRRLPGLRLAEGPQSWRPTFSSRGLAELPLLFQPVSVGIPRP